MTDIHTHILPSVDDGAKDVEESLGLLEESERQGVDVTVLTPHYYGRNRGVEEFLRRRAAAFQKLKEGYRGGIRLVEACECNICTCANSDFSELRALTIGGTRYLLTELSFEDEWSGKLWERLYALLDLGMVPVVAHVELYPAVVRRPALAHRLAEAGCLLQFNCDSVLQKEKLGLVDALARHNQLHCLGSDAHNLERRPPRYKAAAESIVSRYGKDFFDGLQVNMRDILSDRTVATQPSAPVKKNIFGQYR